MSKEIKSKAEIIWEYTAMNEYPTYYHESDIEQMMDQYAEQESCLFAEWIVTNGWYFNKIQRWSNKGETSDNLIEVLTSTKSTTELYQLYLKVKNNK